ncbi:MAG: hypothetical protein WCV90_05620 [Candidatus Woesearchaeota archaeon]
MRFKNRINHLLKKYEMLSYDRYYISIADLRQSLTEHYLEQCQAY